MTKAENIHVLTVISIYFTTRRYKSLWHEESEHKAQQMISARVCLCAQFNQLLISDRWLITSPLTVEGSILLSTITHIISYLYYKTMYFSEPVSRSTAGCGSIGLKSLVLCECVWGHGKEARHRPPCSHWSEPRPGWTPISTTSDLWLEQNDLYPPRKHMWSNMQKSVYYQCCLIHDLKNTKYSQDNVILVSPRD